MVDRITLYQLNTIASLLFLFDVTDAAAAQAFHVRYRLVGLLFSSIQPNSASTIMGFLFL